MRARVMSWMTVVAIAAAVTLGLAVRGGGRAQEAPRNDNFANYEFVQIPLTQSAFTDGLSTAGATTEPGETGCAGASVWYVLRAETSNRIVVDTAGSDFGTAITIFRLTDFAPSPPGGSLEEIACSGAPDAQVALDFDARTNEGLYAIQVGGWEGRSGNLRVRIACDPVCAPPNDSIASATTVFSAPHLDDVDTTSATLEVGEPRPCGDIGNTVWYRFDTSDLAGDFVNVIATSGDFTPVIAAYEVKFISVSPPGEYDFTTLGCFTDSAQDFPSLGFTTEPNTSYYVQVGGAGETGGVVSVLVSCNSDEGCSFAEQNPPDDSETFPPGTGGGESTLLPGTGGGDVLPPNTGSGGYLR